MDLNEVKDSISRVKPVLSLVLDIEQIVDAGIEAEKQAAAAIQAKDEAEVAYRLAHSQRGQIQDEIEKLGVALQERQDYYRAEAQKIVDQHSENVASAEKSVHEFIASLQDAASRAESEAKERIEKAEAAAEEAEARAVKAQEALDALKRA